MLSGIRCVYFKRCSADHSSSRAALQSTLQRHRMVNAALADEFKCGLHALSLTIKTPEELPNGP